MLRFRSSATLRSSVLFSLYGYLPHSDFRVLEIWVILVLILCIPYFIVLLYYCIFVTFILLTFTYILYCFVSILQSSSAYHLDTSAGLLSVVYAPFGSVPAVYCPYGLVLTVLLDDEHCWLLPFLSSTLYPLVDGHSCRWPVSISLGLPTSGWIDIVCWLPVILHPGQLSD